MKSKYTHSAHCVYNIGYHLIWCTKYRKNSYMEKLKHTSSASSEPNTVHLVSVSDKWKPCPTTCMSSSLHGRSRSLPSWPHSSRDIHPTNCCDSFPGCAGGGEHPPSGVSPISAKASDTYPEIRSNATSNFKNKGDLLRSHLRAEAPQYSRLIS